MPREELGDLDAGDARLFEQRRDGASHDGVRSLDAHDHKMSPGAAARTLRSIAVSSARTASASTCATLASTASAIGAVAKITSPSNGVADGSDASIERRARRSRECAQRRAVERRVRGDDAQGRAPAGQLSESVGAGTAARERTPRRRATTRRGRGPRRRFAPPHRARRPPRSPPRARALPADPHSPLRIPRRPSSNAPRPRPCRPSPPCPRRRPLPPRPRVARSHASYAISGVGRASNRPSGRRSNSTAAGTIGTTPAPTSNPRPRSSIQRITPAAASSP